jgi:hypothetical protein
VNTDCGKATVPLLDVIAIAIVSFQERYSAGIDVAVACQFAQYSIYSSIFPWISCQESCGIN